MWRKIYDDHFAKFAYKKKARRTQKRKDWKDKSIVENSIQHRLSLLCALHLKSPVPYCFDGPTIKCVFVVILLLWDFNVSTFFEPSIVIHCDIVKEKEMWFTPVRFYGISMEHSGMLQ